MRGLFCVINLSDFGFIQFACELEWSPGAMTRLHTLERARINTAVWGLGLGPGSDMAMDLCYVQFGIAAFREARWYVFMTAAVVSCGVLCFSRNYS